MGEGDLTRILFVYGDILARGGMEAYMMNYFRHINGEQIRIDFALQRADGAESVEEYEREIIASGGNVYYLPKFGKHPLKYYSELSALMRENGYQIVHSHCDAMNYRVLKIASKCGIKVRISHSHNTEHIVHNELKRKYYEWCKKRINRYATNLWACSEAAGRWMYGENAFDVIPNAIDVDKYGYREEDRKVKREELGFKTTDIVCGMVGRFDVQKNHLFIIDAFKKVKNKNIKVLLIGEGDLKEEIETIVRQYQLSSEVIFAGSVNDMGPYYSSMDRLIMPSLFEGFPVSLVEAQANGLVCYVSDSVTRETAITRLVHYVPLETEAWVDVLENGETGHKKNFAAEVNERGYGIVDSARKVAKRYMELVRADSV